MKSILSTLSRDYLWGWPPGKFTKQVEVRIQSQEKEHDGTLSKSPVATSSSQYRDGFCTQESAGDTASGKKCIQWESHLGPLRQP